MTYKIPADEWRDFLSGTHPHLTHKRAFRFVPSSPRCKLCSAPFGSPGSAIFRRFGFRPWPKNPRICGRCFLSLETYARRCPGSDENQEVGGAEVEISMLFADVRGSSKLARQMPTIDFTRLMNRFYKVSTDVLINADAIVEKFVGDEVVGLFVPFLVGSEHARRAVDTAEELLLATGHDSADGPWCPLGAGVHTGTAFVGMVGTPGAMDFTALGDPMNIAAHLASQAAVGEILVTTEAASAASLPLDGADRRNLSLKGHPVEAVSLTRLPARIGGLDHPPH
jgi:adenylate cyclase